MKKVYYEKVGRKYIPVKEYDSDLVRSYPHGAHLIVVEPGKSSFHYKIDPAFAPVLAAATYGTDALSNAIVQATDLRPHEKLITEEQRAAWKEFKKVMGKDAHLLEWPSARGAAEEVIQALSEETDKMLKVPAVKKAYEQFMMLYKLTKDENDESES